MNKYLRQITELILKVSKDEIDEIQFSKGNNKILLKLSILPMNCSLVFPTANEEGKAFSQEEFSKICEIKKEKLKNFISRASEYRKLESRKKELELEAKKVEEQMAEFRKNKK